MKATEKCFPMVPFIMLLKVVLTFDCVDEILQCSHSNESYWAVLSCGAVYYAVQGGSNFWVCGWNPKVWPFKWKLLSSTFLWCCLLCCTTWFSLLNLCMESLGMTIQLKGCWALISVYHHQNASKALHKNVPEWCLLVWSPPQTQAHCHGLEEGRVLCWDHTPGPPTLLCTYAFQGRFCKQRKSQESRHV